MAKDKDKLEVDRLREEVGARFKEIRTKGLKLSQDKLGQSTPHLEGNNLQVRVASLEKGNGSTATVYTVMKYLYDRGVNINYLFGEEESMLRISKQVSLYPENIIDYLQDVLISAGNVGAIANEIVENTKRVEKYVESTIQIAEQDRSSAKQES
ncbi:hypothetical protein [Lewinella sp. IMCC34191]|uniref:hypothetical protein n=1 Tax=Lewinella sp. IMCC34191 TaxID=2259172 RepID=UPI000E280BB4|nr:hypothetical protein [Lewinella sp. IMCC34191]